MKRQGFFTSIKAKILIRFGIITLVLMIAGGMLAACTKRVRMAQARVAEYTADKMMLQKAVVDHCQWTINLSSAISYGADFNGSTDPATCEFGKFLYSDIVQGDLGWEDFVKDIEPLHKKIHEDAANILAQENQEQAKRIYWDDIRADSFTIHSACQYLSFYSPRGDHPCLADTGRMQSSGAGRNATGQLRRRAFGNADADLGTDSAERGTCKQSRPYGKGSH